MRIEFDYDLDTNGKIFARHFIDTHQSPTQPQVSHPTLGAAPLDVIHLLKAFHDGTLPIAGTGWEQITNHPDYPGKTRLQALIGEIIRLDDKESRTILGV